MSDYDEPVLTTSMWVSAHIRRCLSLGIPAVLVRRGDDRAGIVLIKWNRFSDGCQVLTPSRNAQGGRIWIARAGAAPSPEADCDAYLERQIKYDPDLWILEIEDMEGRYDLGEPIEQQ